MKRNRSERLDRQKTVFGVRVLPIDGVRSLRWLRDGDYLDRDRVTVYPFLFLAVYVLCAFVYVTSSNGALDYWHRPLGTDFIGFWTGSSLMLDGLPEAVYDTRHQLAQQAWLGSQDYSYNSWHYPPILHLFTWPLALMPYGVAFLVWSVVPLCWYLVVIWRIAPRKEAVLLALAFPAVLINLGHGQTGFLTTAIFGAALFCLDRRPWCSGILIAALTFKPQYGVLIPFALAVSDRWKAFLGAALTACALIAATVVCFGFKTWLAFFDKLAFVSHVLTDGLGGYEKMQSVYAALRLWGFSVAAAGFAHAIIASVAAAAVMWIWRKPAPVGMQFAALVTGTLLISPYVLDYDLTLLALPIAWLGVEGFRAGFLPWEKSALVAVWILPLVSRVIATTTFVPVAPVVIGALLLIIMRRALLEASVAAPVPA